MRAAFRILAATIMAAALFAPGAALAQSEGEAGRLDKPDAKSFSGLWAQAGRFAVNNTMFILYHEFGHLLVEELDLPVLGREEDAVDNFATWTMLSKGTWRMEDALRDSAHGWILSERNSNSGYERWAFYDEHSLDLQRAYQIVCLMVGGNRAKFRAFATEMGVHSDRQQSCAWDYQQVSDSFSKLLGPFAAEGERAKVTVVYEPARRNLEVAAEVLKRSGVIEEVADDIRTSYVLPRAVSIRVTNCGEANAFYAWRDNEIIYCYELMNSFMRQYADDIATAE